MSLWEYGHQIISDPTVLYTLKHQELLTKFQKDKQKRRENDNKNIENQNNSEISTVNLFLDPMKVHNNPDNPDYI